MYNGYFNIQESHKNQIKAVHTFNNKKYFLIELYGKND